MRKAVAVLAAIICTVSILLAGCANGENTKSLEMNRLQSDTGAFQFYDLEWKSSPDTVQKALGIPFGQPDTAGGVQIYGAENAYIWEGETASISCEYGADGLSTVTLLFMPEASRRDSFWSAMKEELFRLYGTTEENIQTSTSEKLNITTESESYLWEAPGNEDTLMSVSSLSVNGEFKYIALVVYRMTK